MIGALRWISYINVFDILIYCGHVADPFFIAAPLWFREHYRQ